MINFSEKNIRILSSAALLLVAAIWGFAFVIVKDSLDYVGAVWMVAIRFTIAAIVLSLFSIKRFKNLNPSIIKHGCLLGVFLFSAYLVQTIGCDFTTAGKNAFLTTIYVILVPLLGWPILKKKPALFVWVAAVMSVSGIGLLALNPDDGSILKMNFGDVLTLICGVLYALHIIFGAKYVADEDPIVLTVFQFAVSGILGFIISPVLTKINPALNMHLDLKLLFSSRVVISLLYLSLLSSLLCFVLQNVCLKYVPSALASLFLGLESVFGVLFSVLILKESLTIKMWTGCILIFGAIVVAEVVPQLFRKKEES